MVPPWVKKGAEKTPDFTGRAILAQSKSKVKCFFDFFAEILPHFADKTVRTLVFPMRTAGGCVLLPTEFIIYTWKEFEK